VRPRINAREDLRYCKVLCHDCPMPIAILAIAILAISLAIGIIAAKAQTRRYAAFSTPQVATRIAGHYPLSFDQPYL
jgi:hypothetical protein